MPLSQDKLQELQLQCRLLQPNVWTFQIWRLHETIQFKLVVPNLQQLWNNPQPRSPRRRRRNYSQRMSKQWTLSHKWPMSRECRCRMYLLAQPAMVIHGNILSSPHSRHHSQCHSIGLKALFFCLFYFVTNNTEIWTQ